MSAKTPGSGRYAVTLSEPGAGQCHRVRLFPDPWDAKAMVDELNAGLLRTRPANGGRRFGFYFVDVVGSFHLPWIDGPSSNARDPLKPRRRRRKAAA